jgi:hypothetical protein
MTLRPGFRLVVAPHFHLDADWSGRVSLGAGLEPTAQGFVPRAPWRPAGTEELAALVPSGPVSRDESSGCLCVFVVPVHLRSAFWDMLARTQGLGGIHPDEFDAFVSDLAGFLDFKELRPPAGASFELVVTAPDRPSALTASTLWGLINLGEDAAPVVFLNVPAGDIPAPDYPPVRLQLAPGEGVRFPAGLMLGGDGVERERPDVLLMIRLPDPAGE